MIKYVVCGGWVVSRRGRQEHYLSPRELMKLYNVRAEECIELQDFDDVRRKGFSREYLAKLIWLMPRQDENYEEDSPVDRQDRPGPADG